MKTILVTIGLILALGVNGQISKTIDASDISGTDTILSFYISGISDVSNKQWKCKVTTTESDTIQITFGGVIGNTGKFEGFVSDSLPYTITPAKVMIIQYGDTVYQKTFAGSPETYGFKTPMAKIRPLNDTNNINLEWYFY